MNQYHLKNRPNREITSAEDIQTILKNGKYAVISLCRNNEPYIVSLSYGYDSETNSLFFHAAKNGLKLDFIRANPLVCATIIEDGGYIPDECSHNYRTIVFWGKMSIVEDIAEKKHGLEILLNHLENKPSVIEKYTLKSEIQHSDMEILRLDITQIHGKAGR
jgi:nitroimidazol reductase NimA-like FMN-containing flavoprotein (pyridoxamine 5'-phosphate oxidase superfamily)